MASTRRSRAFKDISLSFVPHPITKDLPVLVNERAIARSVRNLVETIPTERFFNPDLGSDVRNTLFDFCDYGTASIIAQQIEEVVLNYEQRVANLSVEVFPRPDDNTFEVTIAFDIVGQDLPPQNISFILEVTR
jgi:phage baseplate assembly protein W